jgi:hypothetical protein
MSRPPVVLVVDESVVEVDSSGSDVAGAVV